MKSSLEPVLLVLFLLCCGCAWAQTDTGTGDTGVPVQPGPKPAYTYPDTTPSLDFLSGSIENSSIGLGITAGFSYDSNASANSNTSESFLLFHVAPSIRIQQFLPKVSWHFSYSGGYQSYTQLKGSSSNNLFSQGASAGWLWQLARHWQLSADDNFRYSANPFDSFLTSTGTPTMNNPNPVFYTPLTQSTQNNGLLTLTDQMTKVDTLSFAGTANLRRTSSYNLVSSVPFYNLISYGGRANYSHQFSPRLSLGAGYDYNSLDFGKGQQRSGIQNISMTADYLIRPNMSISGWIGPEYTSTKDVVAVPIGGQLVYLTTHDSLWSTSVGANFGWHNQRNSARAGFSRQVSDGGGIVATSQVNSFHGEYRRMLMRKLDGTVGGHYIHDVSTETSSRNFSNISVTAGLSYELAKSLLATASYIHAYQSQSNAILIGSSTYNSNIVGISVTYNWNHPLGR